jgi:hypothetical protein
MFSSHTMLESSRLPLDNRNRNNPHMVESWAGHLATQAIRARFSFKGMRENTLESMPIPTFQTGKSG